MGKKPNLYRMLLMEYADLIYLEDTIGINKEEEEKKEMLKKLLSVYLDMTTSLTKEIKDKIVFYIKQGKTDTFIMTKLKVSYNTISILREELSNDRKSSEKKGNK